MTDQRSLAEQMRTLLRLADQQGLEDAANLLRRQFPWSWENNRTVLYQTDRGLWKWAEEQDGVIVDASTQQWATLPEAHAVAKGRGLPVVVQGEEGQ